MNVFKRTITTTAFQSVELRIGNVDKSALGKVHFGNDNPLVGFYQGPEATLEHSFNLIAQASGRYLTLQTIISEHLMIDEVQVYKR